MRLQRHQKLGLKLWLVAICHVLGSREIYADPFFELEGPFGQIFSQTSVYPVRFVDLQTVDELLDVELEFALRMGEHFRIKARGWSWMRVPHQQGGDAAYWRPYIQLKEGWAEFTSSAVDIRLGNQVISWGAADGVNPTDLAHAMDFYDPFYPRKLPITAARFVIHPPALPSWTLELLYSPIFYQSILPIELPDSGPLAIGLGQTRWLISAPNFVQASGFLNQVQYSVESPTFPITHSGGARLGFSSSFGWDFSLSAFSGVENMPRIGITRQGTTGPGLPIDVTFHPSFHRFLMGGIDGQGSIPIGDEELGARFEVAYVFRDNTRALNAPSQFQSDLLKDDFVHLIVGLDYSLPVKFLWSYTYLNLQYVIYRRLLKVEQNPGESVLSGLPTAIPFDFNLVFFMENRFGSKWALGHQLIWSHLNMDAMYGPELSYAITDTLKASLGGQIFFGRRLGFFGQFANNSRAVGTVKWVF